MSHVRLFATDLDGTLLRSDGTISQPVKDLLARVTLCGVRVVPVTARPPRLIADIVQQIGLSGMVICCNGALVFDSDQQAIVAHIPLPAAIARDLVRALKAAVPGVCFAAERGLSYGMEPAYAALRPATRTTAHLIADAEELCQQDVTKLMAMHPTMDYDALLADVARVAGTNGTVTHSNRIYVEISAPGVTKATGLSSLCASLAIDASTVVACGDMPNDLPMLCWAGRSVAVANAHPDVLAAVTDRVPSNNDDGLAVVLRAILSDGDM